jgi:hypothetical protein
LQPVHNHFAGNGVDQSQLSPRLLPGQLDGIFFKLLSRFIGMLLIELADFFLRKVFQRQ